MSQTLNFDHFKCIDKVCHEKAMILANKSFSK